jgi:hypothetical protein
VEVAGQLAYPAALLPGKQSAVSIVQKTRWTPRGRVERKRSPSPAWNQIRIMKNNVEINVKVHTVECRDPLLGSNREINNETKSAARQQILNKQQLKGNNLTAPNERSFLRGPCWDIISRTIVATSQLY